MLSWNLNMLWLRERLHEKRLPMALHYSIPDALQKDLEARNVPAVQIYANVKPELIGKEVHKKMGQIFCRGVVPYEPEAISGHIIELGQANR